MSSLSRSRSLHPWPEEVTKPGFPEWEKTAFKWLWELLPTHCRDQWLLVSHPLLLARQARRQVEGEIYMLRYKRSSHYELKRLGLSPAVIEEVIRLDAEEVHRLTRVKEEVMMVAQALALSPAGGCRGSRRP
ncbi:hypothetical protein [Streptomyces sp. L2]|uniref:hypothetical protein n=1 Tax=Streptomyces sp. L2 TaxID=2162665 RepID=UPI00101036B4|nr:hypothetical protein [Streptomyces sp. L2]